MKGRKLSLVLRGVRCRGGGVNLLLRESGEGRGVLNNGAIKRRTGTKCTSERSKRLCREVAYRGGHCGDQVYI